MHVPCHGVVDLPSSCYLPELGAFVDGMAFSRGENWREPRDFDVKAKVRPSHDIVRKPNLGPNFDPGGFCLCPDLCAAVQDDEAVWGIVLVLVVVLVLEGSAGSVVCHVLGRSRWQTKFSIVECSKLFSQRTTRGRELAAEPGRGRGRRRERERFPIQPRHPELLPQKSGQ